MDGPGLLDGWPEIVGWMDGPGLYGWMDLLDGWPGVVDRWMDGWMDGWPRIVGWMDLLDG